MSDAGEVTTASGQVEEEAWVGRVLDDRYRIVRQLGEGGMGAVFVAEHLTLGKEVALKVIHPELAGNENLAARFAREAMASAKLDHPHVASALDYGKLPEGGSYLVMQLVRGRSITDVVHAEGRMHWARAAEIAAQVADALAAAHAAGIVHRDLKPDNVQLERRDDGSFLVKVLDFGIARVPTDVEQGPAEAAPSRALTKVGTVMGTPGYMSPEQATGEVVDHRTDLYALGVVLWEVVVGTDLFPGEEFTDILRKQLTEDPPTLSVAASDPSIPPELDRLVASLLAQKAHDRPDKAGAVRDALRALVYRASMSGELALPLSGPITGPFPTVTDATPKPADEWKREAPTRKRPTGVAAVGTILVSGDPADRPARNRILALGGAAALLGAVVLAGFLYSAFGGGDEMGPEELPGAAPAPSLVERVLRNVPQVPSGPPAEVQERFDAMLAAERSTERRAAAEWLLAREPADDVPEWMRVVADLEAARGCGSRRRALEAIRQLGDARAVPSVQRLSDQPRRGCGFLSRADCYECIREELGQTLAALQD